MVSVIKLVEMYNSMSSVAVMKHKCWWKDFTVHEIFPPSFHHDSCASMSLAAELHLFNDGYMKAV